MHIDVHGHLAPLGENGGGPPALFDPEGAIAAKRARGIGMTVIGSPVGAGSMLPGSGADNHAQTVDEVRRHNEAMGELVTRFPDSLRSYAYLDPFGGDAMLGQAVELTKQWQFVGFIVNTSIDGAPLGDPRAEDFVATAAESGLPVLLHPPAEPLGWQGLGHGLIEHVARPCDVTLGVAAVVCAGWLERYPELRLIAAAGGGGLASLAEKLDLAARTSGPGAAGGSDGWSPRRSLRRILVETSCPSPVQLRANLATFGASHVLLGTDGPPLLDQVDPIVDMLAANLDEVALDAVCHGNARELFGLGEPAGRRG